MLSKNSELLHHAICLFFYLLNVSYLHRCTILQYWFLVFLHLYSYSYSWGGYLCELYQFNCSSKFSVYSTQSNWVWDCGICSRVWVCVCYCFHLFCFGKFDWSFHIYVMRLLWSDYFWRWERDFKAIFRWNPY